MFVSTNTLRKLGATVLVAATAAFAVPAAFAWDGPPDALDRYVGADVTSAHVGFQGSPDALDRYNAPASTWDGPPDAIDRYRESQQFAVLAATRPGWDGPPDAIDRYVGRTGTPATTVNVDGGFAWSEFGIGAGAMLGAVLLLVGISLGALALRHRSGSLSTS